MTTSLVIISMVLSLFSIPIFDVHAQQGGNAAGGSATGQGAIGGNAAGGSATGQGAIGGSAKGGNATSNSSLNSGSPFSR